MCAARIMYIVHRNYRQIDFDCVERADRREQTDALTWFAKVRIHKN